MLMGALIGLIVGLIIFLVKKNQESNAIDNAINQDILDTPDYVEFFHYSSEKSFAKGNLKFFDSRGAGSISGSRFVFKPQKGASIEIDLQYAQFKVADKQKRKMVWIEFETGREKHYFTVFRAGFWKVDKSGMSKFIQKLKEFKS